MRLGRAWQRLMDPFTQALAGSVVLKVGSAVFALVTSLLLARLLGSGGYGAYAFAVAWATLIGVPALLGMDRLVVRSVAAYAARDEWGLARGMVRRANEWVLVAAVLLASGGALVGWFVLQGVVRTTFLTGMLLVPILALGKVRMATLQGLHRVVIGQMPELLLVHLVLLALLAVAQLAGVLSAPLAMQAHVVAACVALVAGMVLLTRYRPSVLRTATPAYENRPWLRAAVPLTLLSGIMIINGRTDVVMVGWLAGISEAGTYDVASKLSDTVAFLLTALNQAAAPAFARLHALGQREELQNLVVRKSRLILAGTLPFAVGLLVFAQPVLSIFGPDYSGGRLALSILVVGQIVNVAAGPVGLLLVMSGHERLVAVGFGAGAIANLLLNLLLIPIWGLAGAAVATAGSMVIWNTILIVFVVRKLGIRPWTRSGAKTSGQT